MVLPSLRYIYASYDLNRVSNHISSSLSCSMVVPNNYLLSFGLRTFHRSLTWNPISAFIRLLILGQWHYKLQWPIVTRALVLFSKISSRAQGSLVRSYSMTPKYISIQLSTSNILVTAVSGRGSSVGLRLVPVRESLMQLKLR